MYSIYHDYKRKQTSLYIYSITVYTSIAIGRPTAFEVDQKDVPLSNP